MLSTLFGGGGEASKPAAERSEDDVREWSRQLRTEMRGVERQVRAIEREEQKVQREARAAAKRGDAASARIMARELVNSRHAKERMYTSRAQMNSILMTLTQQHSLYKATGTLQASAAILAAMNDLVKLPELNQSLMVMAREMERAGLIEEMVSEAMGMDDEELEEDADAEVDKVMSELLSAAGPVPSTRVPAANAPNTATPSAAAARQARSAAAAGRT